MELGGRLRLAEGVAGHVTVRDPEHTDHFWVNPMGRSFKQMTVSDLLLVNHVGEIVEGEGLLNGSSSVAVSESDFVFAIVGEELGLAGTLWVLVLHAALAAAVPPDRVRLYLLHGLQHVDRDFDGLDAWRTWKALRALLSQRT